MGMSGGTTATGGGGTSAQPQNSPTPSNPNEIFFTGLADGNQYRQVTDPNTGRVQTFDSTGNLTQTDFTPQQPDSYQQGTLPFQNKATNSLYYGHYVDGDTYNQLVAAGSPPPGSAEFNQFVFGQEAGPAGAYTTHRQASQQELGQGSWQRALNPYPGAPTTTYSGANPGPLSAPNNMTGAQLAERAAAYGGTDFIPNSENVLTRSDQLMRLLGPVGGSMSAYDYFGPNILGNRLGSDMALFGGTGFDIPSMIMNMQSGLSNGQLADMSNLGGQRSSVADLLSNNRGFGAMPMQGAGGVWK